MKTQKKTQTVKINDMTTWPSVEIKRFVRKNKATRMAHLKCGDRRSVDNTPRTHVRCRPCAVRIIERRTRKTQKTQKKAA